MAGLWSLGEAQLARRALLSRWTAEAIGVARHVRRGLGAQGKAAASADAAVSRRGQSGVRHVAPVGRLLHQDRRQYQRRGRRPMIGEGPCAQQHTEQRDDTCSHLVTMPRVPCSHHTGQLRRDANTWQRAGAAIPLSQTRRLHSPPPRGNCRPSLLRQISATVAEKEATAQAELPKNFDFSNEERLYKWWESNGYFKPAEDSKERPFTMAMPPPNVTGALHMGHAMFVTLQDILARFHRMNGSPTLWLPGTDHAGIATQLVVEKMLATQGIKRTDLQREDFEKKVWEWKEKYGGTITNQMRRLGASCDWSRERFTLDENLSRTCPRLALFAFVLAFVLFSFPLACPFRHPLKFSPLVMEGIPRWRLVNEMQMQTATGICKNDDPQSTNALYDFPSNRMYGHYSGIWGSFQSRYSNNNRTFCSGEDGIWGGAKSEDRMAINSSVEPNNKDQI